MVSYFLPTACSVKPFTMFAVDAAGNNMTSDYPTWLRAWTGHLTKKEKVAYERVLPSRLKAFDQLKKNANASSQPPLTKFADKSGKQISFRKQWDMVVAEHIRLIIARPGKCDRYRGDTDYESDDESITCNVKLPPPCPDSSTSDFSYTSDEDDDERFSCQIPPVTKFPYLNFPDMSVNSNWNPSPTRHVPAVYPTITLSADPTVPLRSNQRDVPAGVSAFIDDYLAARSNRSDTPADRARLIQALERQQRSDGHQSDSSVEEEHYPTDNAPDEVDVPARNITFFAGPHATFLHGLFSDVPRHELIEFCALYLIPSRPDITALSNLVQFEGALNIQQTSRLLDYLSALGGVEPTDSSVDGSTAGNSTSSVVHSFGEAASEGAGLDVIGAPSLGATSAINNLPPRSGTSSMQHLHSLLKATTIDRAIDLAKQMSKSDMVAKLEESSSLELAKRFLNTPNAVFVLHNLYKKPGERVGVRAVPRLKVNPGKLMSDCFMLIETKDSEVLAGPVDSSLVRDWRQAQKETEVHIQSHITALKLAGSNRSDSREVQLLKDHVHCMKLCGPMVCKAYDQHKKRMEAVGHLLTSRHHQIGKMLLRTLDKFSILTPQKIEENEEHIKNLEDAQEADQQGSALDLSDSDGSYESEEEEVMI